MGDDNKRNDQNSAPNKNQPDKNRQNQGGNRNDDER